MAANSLYSPTATATARRCALETFTSHWQRIFKCEYVIIVEDFNARINEITTARRHGIAKTGEHHFAVGIITGTVFNYYRYTQL